jgi:hypothetical protein
MEHLFFFLTFCPPCLALGQPAPTLGTIVENQSCEGIGLHPDFNFIVDSGFATCETEIGTMTKTFLKTSSSDSLGKKIDFKTKINK